VHRVGSKHQPLFIAFAAASMVWSCGRESSEQVDAENLDSTAREADSSEDAPPAEVGAPCTATGSECAASEYCNAPTCAGGTCETRPTAPSLDFVPVCGCDGISYWNAEQLRRTARRSATPVSAAVPGVQAHAASDLQHARPARRAFSTITMSASSPIHAGGAGTFPRMRSVRAAGVVIETAKHRCV